jgi:ribonuclease HII
MKICGIDEAGRGPVIGPMVVAGTVYDSDGIKSIEDSEIDDSKKLSPKKRNRLFSFVTDSADSFYIAEISNKEVDDALNNPDLNLNKLEAIHMVNIIKKLLPDMTIIDCPSTNPVAYLNYLSSLFKANHSNEIIKNGDEWEMIMKFDDRSMILKALYKADEKYKVVGAASILAKVTRDNRIEEMKEKIGIDFGSGYPSDPKTQSFLRKYHGQFDIFRTTWSSYKRLNKKTENLNKFLK